MAWNQRDAEIGYWVVALTLTLGGLIAASGLIWLGIPAFLLGLTLLAMGRLRGRPRVFWPVVGGVVIFLGVTTAVMPMGCTATTPEAGSSATATPDHTECSNALGLRYSGGGDYSPSYVPALLAGLLAGGGGAGAIGLATGRRPDRPRRHQGAPRVGR